MRAWRLAEVASGRRDRACRAADPSNRPRTDMTLAARRGFDLLLQHRHPGTQVLLADEREDDRDHHRGHAAHLHEFEAEGDLRRDPRRPEGEGVRVVPLLVVRVEHESIVGMVLDDLPFVDVLLVVRDLAEGAEPAADGVRLALDPLDRIRLRGPCAVFAEIGHPRPDTFRWCIDRHGGFTAGHTSLLWLLAGANHTPMWMRPEWRRQPPVGPLFDVADLTGTRFRGRSL